MGPFKVKINDLPDLPFEKLLNYLCLADLIRSRAVSRRWCKTIDRFRVNSFCFSDRPIEFIFAKNRPASGELARNFIGSPRFEVLFKEFSKSIFLPLKHLCLCEVDIYRRNEGSNLAQIFNSFCQLEKLDIIKLFFDFQIDLELNLPMLQSIRFEDVRSVKKLTLVAPKLQKVKIWTLDPPLKLKIVYPESVEELVAGLLDNAEKIVKKLKNLKYLHYRHLYPADSTFLSDLKHLEEVHLSTRLCVRTFFEQKERYGRVNLKIFYFGLLLSGPEDEALNWHAGTFKEDFFKHLAENHTRLTDKQPLYPDLDYEQIRRVDLALAMNVLNRWTDLDKIFIKEPVQDIEHFLQLLNKLLKNAETLHFWSNQPQELFDRLPEYGALRGLIIYKPPLNLEFLFKLKNLLYLRIHHPIGTESARKVCEDLKLLLVFSFEHSNSQVQIEIDQIERKKFTVFVDETWADLSDLNSVIQFIFGNTKKRKRQTENFESS